MTVRLRREDPSDHRLVEVLTREAFWGMSGPGCDEHLLVHRLRTADCFVPELDVVAELDGVVVGHVVYSRARVVGPGGRHPVLTFGPLTVHPAHQNRGIGGALMRHTLAEAARLGHRAVVVYGHPDYYPRFGFRPGAQVGITAPGGASFDALMALALVPGGLDGVHGEFHEDDVFHLDPDDAAAFDATFPPKEPAVLTPLDVLDGGGAGRARRPAGARRLGPGARRPVQRRRGGPAGTASGRRVPTSSAPRCGSAASAGASRLRDRCSVRHAVQVEPGAVLADEPADLVQRAGARWCPVVGAELDNAVGVEQPAALGAQHVQPVPAHLGVQVELRGAGAGVPGGAQVAPRRRARTR